MPGAPLVPDGMQIVINHSISGKQAQFIRDQHGPRQQTSNQSWCASGEELWDLFRFCLGSCQECGVPPCSSPCISKGDGTPLSGMHGMQPGSLRKSLSWTALACVNITQNSSSDHTWAYTCCMLCQRQEKKKVNKSPSIPFYWNQMHLCERQELPKKDMYLNVHS